MSWTRALRWSVSYGSSNGYARRSHGFPRPLGHKRAGAWNEEWADPPTREGDHQIDNVRFRAWVETTFDVEIPQRATDIVARPAEFGDLDTDDVWCRWVNTASERT